MLRKSVYWTAPKTAGYHEEPLRTPKEHEVLINTKFSLVSKSTERQWLLSDANHGVIGTTFPFTPGYSSAGIVYAVGDQVTQIKPGEKVVGAPTFGAHSNFTFVDEKDVYPVAPQTKLDDAVFFNLGMTAIYSFMNSQAKLGDSIVLIGQGVVGSIATQTAKASGCYPIVAVDIDETARKIALQNGADFAIDPTDNQEIEKLIQQFQGFDVAIDMSGSNAGMNLALHMAKTLGTVVLCTGGLAGKQPLDYEEIALKCLTVKGDFVNAQMDLQRKCIHIFLHLLASGAIKAPEHADALLEPTESNIKMVYQKVVDQDRSLRNAIFTW